MPKIGMGPLRRKQLVDATIASIHEFGLANTTVTKIAKKAGVSPGIVHHYFADKDELLFETMRHMLAALKAQTVTFLASAKTPQERLAALIAASFAKEQFSRESTTAWLALYASARVSTKLAKILKIYHRRLASNLIFALRQINPQMNHPMMAEAIASLIDGVYLRAALNPDLYQTTTPEQIALDFISQIGLLPAPTDKR